MCLAGGNQKGRRVLLFSPLITNSTCHILQKPHSANLIVAASRHASLHSFFDPQVLHSRQQYAAYLVVNARGQLLTGGQATKTCRTPGRDPEGWQSIHGLTAQHSTAHLVENARALIIDSNPIPSCSIRLGVCCLQPLSQHPHILQVNVKQLLQARPLHLHNHGLPLVGGQMHLYHMLPAVKHTTWISACTFFRSMLKSCFRPGLCTFTTTVS